MTNKTAQITQKHVSNFKWQGWRPISLSTLLHRLVVKGAVKEDVIQVKNAFVEHRKLTTYPLPKTMRIAEPSWVPWKGLGKEPVIVLIDQVFILASPAPDGRSLKGLRCMHMVLNVKMSNFKFIILIDFSWDWVAVFVLMAETLDCFSVLSHEAESATLEAISRSKLGNPPAGNSWLGSLIATIIGNLKISISNVHIRYEDSVSNPGHPFSCGVTLAKLAAVTMDEHGNETFDTSGALDKLRKSLQLERLAMYHDSNRDPWKLDKRWEDLSPREWIEIFEDGINESSKGSSLVSPWARDRNYLVSPINGVLKYHRLGNQERNDSSVPFEKASLVISDVSLTITEAQYHDWIKLMEVISTYRTHVEVSHLRPMVPVSEGAALWWRYAAQAGVQQKKMCYRFSWEQIQNLCHLRRRYVQLYADSLQRVNVDNSEIRDIEKDLDPKVILLWRFLAHAKVESVKSKEAAEQRMLRKNSWFSLRWRSTSVDDSAVDTSSVSRSVEERLTKEEWEAVNKLLSYQPDEDLAHVGKDMQNMIHYMIIVSISKAAARIVNINNTEIVCGRFENLNVSTKFKHRSTHCVVTLQYYGLSSPEGSLAQSVSNEQKVNALQASFVHTPAGENVDWRLSATISPCHVTVIAESYERFLHFLKRSTAVSPTVALETATALQHKIEEVTRRAQEQFQMVLEEQSRVYISLFFSYQLSGSILWEMGVQWIMPHTAAGLFLERNKRIFEDREESLEEVWYRVKIRAAWFALDIDLDAPKVRVPLRSCTSTENDSHLLLDFGHFTLQTKDGADHGHSLYSRFHISGRDIAAFFTDCGSKSQSFDWGSQPSISACSEDANKFYSLIDRCGMAVIVDQVPHPNHPSTHISVQIPSLGIHFSPDRYFRLSELLNLLSGAMPNDEQHTVEPLQTGIVPWNPPYRTTEARILVWKGIGYSVAAWQPCFLVLSGLYLYVLESETSQSYQRCSSMAGKQVCDVPPTNVGGSPLCIAVSTRGMDIQKALESFSTLIVEFPNEEVKSTWLRELVQSTYRASAPPSVDILDGLRDDPIEFAESRASNVKAADLVVNGTVVETKLSLYGKFGDDEQERIHERIILQVLAGGGKTELLINHEYKRGLRLVISRMLWWVDILLNIWSSPSKLEPQGKDLSEVTVEEDDVFKDALPDFVILHDSAETGFHENDLSKGKVVPSDVFYEAMGSDDSDFVSVMFLTRNPGSPDYNGIDTEMSIRMSKLEFYCNRPTLVALISFGFDLNSANSGISSPNIENPDDEPLANKDKIEEYGHASSIKGLLGFGKGRVVFYLNMNVDSVTMFLNKEDGSQLAMFVQESFLLDIKVHPSSTSIEGTLGNFRLYDLSLGSDHCWGWLCDLRNQEAESLIQFTFNSYSIEDDDYEGYDYSLSGRLSAVRIVFLYRFVQEVVTLFRTTTGTLITAYFMELATPHSEEAIKLVDKVGGIEWLIQKYEVDGASAVKLDLSLDNPIIVVPRNSLSKDTRKNKTDKLKDISFSRILFFWWKRYVTVSVDSFMQLDLGHLRIRNAFSWHGCPEKDPSAVHLDVLDAEILGINMAVGINGSIGKPMIREGREDVDILSVFMLMTQVGSLHAVMSDKEYNVILDCFYMNLCEQPTLPPSFRSSKSSAKDTIKLLADKVNMNSQVLLSRTVTIVAVEVDYALLELFYGDDKESPLAHVILEGLWVSYRMTSLSEADLFITIPKFSILDIRPNTKAEMRLMLGSCTDVSKQMSPERNVDLPNSTMFLMDGRWRLSSQSFVVRVQQPRILVVPDFLLAVCEFFVPALGTITGRDEMMDPKNDPISKNNSIVLSAPLYKQTEDVMLLSPSLQLIADAVGIDEYIYDGCGKTICLVYEKEEKQLHLSVIWPIIIIGREQSRIVVSEYNSCTASHISFAITMEFLHHKHHTLCLSGGHWNCTGDIPCFSFALENEEYRLEPFSKLVSLSLCWVIWKDRFKECDGLWFQHLHLEYIVTKALKAIQRKINFSSVTFSFGGDVDFLVLNGLLLRKCTYLSNDSSYSVSPEDGVEISFLDDNSLNRNSKDSDYLEELSPTPHASDTVHCESSKIPSFSFEAQVVSPEFTFYDSSKSFLDDSTHGEKLLRAKTDFSFMYASKEDDRWIRGLLKDLTVEAGSGLVVLDPVDVSGGYTSVKDKTNISIMFTDIFAHLSLSVISLLLNLQSQASTALQFGNADPLSPCTNFDRIWVSPKENGRLSNLTFWRPRAPSNYVVLGDCVTSRPNPPSQSVLAVSNDMVVVRKPLGFKFIGSFSSIQGQQTDEVLSNIDSDCSLWLPVAPSGYLALGCVAHVGSQPPPSHIVHCIRSDLHMASRQLSRVILCTSIRWLSVQKCCFDLNHLLLWNSSQRQSSSNESLLDFNNEHENACLQASHQGATSSGWDVLRSISKASTYYMSTPNFERIWWDRGGDLRRPFSIWRPLPRLGYAILGDCITEGLEPPPLGIIFKADDPEISAKPVQFTKVAHIGKKGQEEACTFLARSDLKKPSSRLAFAIGDSMKPKTRDNITAEMKIRCFSLTILDSLCGMMTPLFDATITNIKLASHGRLEAMNAVLISSFAASTFNIHLEAWEPLVEPFDGIFKLETYDTNLSQPVRVGKRMRIAATSTLNVNLSAANIDTLAQTMDSWRRQRELEKKAIRLYEKAAGPDVSDQKSTLLALDEDDFQTVMVENKLGCDIYLKKTQHDFDTVDLLRHDDSAAMWIPPPRYSDRLNVLDESREPRCYVGVQIFEAKGLPLVDDGNSHRFSVLCGCLWRIRKLIRKSFFHKVREQSVLNHLLRKVNGFDEGTAKWNELFIFEVPQKGMAKLEVEVTNLAAKAGKGEVVGACSFSVGHGTSMLKKVASVKMLNQTSDVQSIVSYPLKRKGQHIDEMHSHCCLSVSTSFIEKSMVTDFDNKWGDGNDLDGDMGFWVGLGPEGPWDGFRSLLPLSVIPRKLKDDFVALEVSMQDGKKHAVFRGLAMVTNDSDIRLNISTCPVSMFNGHDISSRISNNNIVIEEIFENQQYRPVSGWGNNEYGSRDRDPGRWSTRDFSYSSKEFFEPPLPPGWEWASTWTVDRSQFVDTDGWAYGPDYQSLKWPPNSPKSGTKSARDAVRRRRWTRTRQEVDDWGTTNQNFLDITICPGCSSVLPWRSMSRDSNQCLQIRPSSDHSQTSYAWGRPVSVEKDALFVDQASLFVKLEKKDLLWCCPGSSGRLFWLSIGTDASVLHTDLNTPVYDWKISASSPLRLENRLPCSAEFKIWERLRDGKNIERQHGFVPSRGTVHIYSADIRNPIYVMLFVQGGWVTEKDPVLILDMGSGNHVSSFWMFHQQRKSSLDLSLIHQVFDVSTGNAFMDFVSSNCFLDFLMYFVEHGGSMGKMMIDVPVLLAIFDSSMK
ncbi:hypothetical protein DH2020_004327 [Rehmannia glutinosa]|uniref:PH domain-containing protein n=1 Tax=Rehmannia glutinosa TaxID=99300 RepID=A0ABR0XP58_REHGL